jgi:bidirectional [NiFe] hydrogenase diaphorase subunit
MNETVTLRIDGAPVKAAQGTSVLEAALDYGICIPHLCNIKGVSPVGVCRLCIVEVEKKGKSRVTASCTLEVEEGMEIKAHTEKVNRIRKGVAELLVAEAPNSRAVQDIAVLCGVTSVGYPFRNEQCVLCGRCVRVCTEVWRGNALGQVGRGELQHIALPFDKRPDSCKRCNACITVCPMMITPCDGPMKTGQEYLCGKCASQLSMSAHAPGSCVRCRLGKGFDCIRQVPVIY